MIDTLKKAFWVLSKRPTHFLGIAGQYFRFYRTHMFQGFVFSSEQGIHLGENVRVQSLGCLSAERPEACIEVGNDSIIYEKANIEAYGKGRISIGAQVIIGEAKIYSRDSIKLGSRVVTSWNVFVQDFDPHPVEPELRRIQMEQMCENFKPSYRDPKPVDMLNWTFPTAPIVIGDDVWLGANVTILKGVQIGDGCIVATGAVVTAGDYPARSLIAGSPAKVLKSL